MLMCWSAFKARWLMKWSSLPRLGGLRLVHADLTLMMWHSILELLPQKDAWKLGRQTLFATCSTAYIKAENLPFNLEVDYIPWHVFTFCNLEKTWRIDLELPLKSRVTQMLSAVFKKDASKQRYSWFIVTCAFTPPVGPLDWKSGSNP